MITPTNVTNGMLKVLEVIKSDETALPKWHQLLDLLTDSKILFFLQELGRVQQLPFDTPNYIQAQAVEAARAYGVNQTLDWLINFRDVLSTARENQKIPFEFSGLETALSSGDITKEEYDAIRYDQPIPEYSFSQPRYAKHQQPGAPAGAKDIGNKTVSG